MIDAPYLRTRLTQLEEELQRQRGYREQLLETTRATAATIERLTGAIAMLQELLVAAAPPAPSVAVMPAPAEEASASPVRLREPERVAETA